MIYEKYERHATSNNVLVEQIVFIVRGLGYANPFNFAQVIEIPNGLESMVTLFAFSKWLARHSTNVISIQNTRIHMLRPTFFMTFRTSLP